MHLLSESISWIVDLTSDDNDEAIVSFSWNEELKLLTDVITSSFLDDAVVRLSIQVKISSVASSIEVFISEKLLLASSIELCWVDIAELPEFIAFEAFNISILISSKILVMLWTASLEFSANFLTSPATTEKPLPASPALAASIAAFKDNKFVWAAIWLIESVILFTDSNLETNAFTVVVEIPKAFSRSLSDVFKLLSVLRPVSANLSVS